MSTPAQPNGISQVQRFDPTTVPSPQWPIAITVGLALNILAGIVTALILSVADTPSKILIGSTVLVFLGLAIWCVFLLWRTRRLTEQLQRTAASLNTCEIRYTEQLTMVGISEFAAKLGESRWSPTGVMARAHHEVRFLGVFGHKWVMDAQKRDAFRAMLTRVQLKRRSRNETLNAPQLVFAPERPGGPWTLYQAIILLFEYLWVHAADPFAAETRGEAGQQASAKL